jgi:hypothetical protein
MRTLRFCERVSAKLARLYLKPGEEIRTPLIAALFWQGTDTARARNLWRRWFMAHNLPRLNGRPPATMMQMQRNLGHPEAQAPTNAPTSILAL